MGLRELALLTFITTAAAWGPDGHTTVAHLAEQYLHDDVKAALLADLGSGNLSYASNWNDDFDHTPVGKWSEPLHFINYPGRSCNFVWARDCVNDRCNPGAIVNYTRQVFDKSLDKDRRFFALKFLIHMMGDLHQPLHVASIDDIGGNAIKLAGTRFSSNHSEWANYTNLHSQWDDGIVAQVINDLQGTGKGDQILAKPPHPHKPYVRHYRNWPLLAHDLETRLNGAWAANRTQWEKALVDPRDDKAFRAGLTSIAEESAAAGCAYSYVNEKGLRVKSGDILSRDYYERAKPVVLAQLAKGGVRLAHLLNLARQASQDHEEFTIIVV
eukprot:TRINITY_DN6958_c0_g2_i1.p1 TRINITY_DN6958_c0_g2~~TRINITY_DN6958_c0_g2_i1.p1  ORF type:complete len:327 (-),score=54.61 TRINITY_DN6958_c0_g2_i1:97-1077(-)